MLLFRVSKSAAGLRANLILVYLETTKQLTDIDEEHSISINAQSLKSTERERAENDAL